MLRTTLAALLLAASVALPAAAHEAKPKIAAPKVVEDAALQAAIGGAWRSPEDKARDPYRHPFEALTFWGLRPGATVIEIGPGGGAWWTQILAPYAASTGGTYVAALADRGNPALTDLLRARAEKSHSDFVARYSAPHYGSIKTADFSTARGLTAPADSADLILVARAFHNWALQEGAVDTAMASFARVLKPGGVLAVEQHRALPGADPKAGTGYVPESYVIEAAKKAGLALDARSELNANPKDDRDHPFGVWTLKPVRASKPGEGDRDVGKAPLTPEERAAFDAIGESDRMTLRFRKPR